MDGNPFLPGEIHMDDVPSDMAIPDPGVSLGNGVHLRYRDLLASLSDQFVYQIWNQAVQARLNQAMDMINQQLVGYGLSWRVKWYFFPHRNCVELVLAQKACK